MASLGVGLAMLVGVPVACVFMFITIIGIPLGMTLLAGYALMLMLGYLVGGLFVGDFVLDRFSADRAASLGWRILFLLLALVLLAFLRRVPAIGGLAVLLVFLSGVGALTLCAWRNWRGPDAPEAPAAVS